MIHNGIDVLGESANANEIVCITSPSVTQTLSKSSNRRIGVLMNGASIDRQYRFSDQVIGDSGLGEVVALFSPQHGFWSDAQANMVETDHSRCPRTGLPIYSLYSKSRRPSPEMLQDIDLLVVDLQDVGVRVYTFAWTVMECLIACRDSGTPVLVLDRMNPIGGKHSEGPNLVAGFESFVGRAYVPLRHGLTLGELSLLIRSQHDIKAELSIIAARGLRRDHDWLDMQVPWIPPSPNLPRVWSLWTYPGMVMFEGTNVSEGRGTTTPFEVVGAPWMDSVATASQLNECDLSGVRFLPTRFTPSFDKFSGKSCSGVSIHVTDREAFRPCRTGIAILSTIHGLYPDEFRLLDPPYEYEDKLAPIDIISGNDALREWLTGSSSGLSDRAIGDLTDSSDWVSAASRFWIYD